ncbi:MAG: (2Fe-2S)-binding protein [Actinobacteria bacterium]|nr:(2Fe-2S)-binding protein [Actinomycetota bacterium]
MTIPTRNPSAQNAPHSQAAFACHCKHVTYGTVDEAISAGATSITDLQRETTACTRCFGCRHELERMLEEKLGSRFEHQATITLPEGMAKTSLPRPMYMPVLAGYSGLDVWTRVIVFNFQGPPEPAPFRLDILRADGERVRASNHVVASGASTVVDLPTAEIAPLLPDGFGVAKLVLEVAEVGSLRPYFHFISPTCISSTHEKTGAPKPTVGKGRNYHWIFPIGTCPNGEEAFFFCTNTQMDPMDGQSLIWQNDAGDSAATPVPRLEFDQSVCIPAHESFPAIEAGAESGAVRLEPADHVVAGFMIRLDRERQLWRVQHL